MSKEGQVAVALGSRRHIDGRVSEPRGLWSQEADPALKELLHRVGRWPHAHGGGGHQHGHLTCQMRKTGRGGVSSPEGVSPGPGRPGASRRGTWTWALEKVGIWSGTVWAGDFQARGHLGVHGVIGVPQWFYGKTEQKVVFIYTCPTAAQPPPTPPWVHLVQRRPSPTRPHPESRAGIRLPVCAACPVGLDIHVRTAPAPVVSHRSSPALRALCMPPFTSSLGPTALPRPRSPEHRHVAVPD